MAKSSPFSTIKVLNFIGFCGILCRPTSGFKTLAGPNHNRPLEGLTMTDKVLSKRICLDKIDVETLRQCFRYEPETGKLFWLRRPDHHFSSPHQANTTNKRWAGREAFTSISDHGYRYGNLFGKRRNAHGLIWAIVHGEYPEQIDHINGERTDNRLCNLRNVSFTENARNQKTARNNTSGFRGVSYIPARQRWSVGIGVGGKWLMLGRYRCIARAISERRKAEIELGYHPNHGRA